MMNINRMVKCWTQWQGILIIAQLVVWWIQTDLIGLRWSTWGPAPCKSFSITVPLICLTFNSGSVDVILVKLDDIVVMMMARTIMLKKSNVGDGDKKDNYDDGKNLSLDVSLVHQLQEGKRAHCYLMVMVLVIILMKSKILVETHLLQGCLAGIYFSCSQ